MAQLTKKDEQDIKKIFDVFDKDKNNFITLKELKAGLRVFHGENPTEKEIKEVYDSMGLKTGSKIYLDDFRKCLARYTQKKKTESKEDKKEGLRAAFKVFDKDNSGFVDKKELESVLLNLGDEMTQAEIDDMFQAADINNDGKIDYDEYIEVLIKEVQIS